MFPNLPKQKVMAYKPSSPVTRDNEILPEPARVLEILKGESLLEKDDQAPGYSGKPITGTNSKHSYLEKAVMCSPSMKTFDEFFKEMDLVESFGLSSILQLRLGFDPIYKVLEIKT